MIPAGTYLTGALFFRNGVNLEIRKDATLCLHRGLDDFPQIPTRFEGTEKYWRSALLNLPLAECPRLWRGRILGRGQEWSQYKSKDGLWDAPG